MLTPKRKNKELSRSYQVLITLFHGPSWQGCSARVGTGGFVLSRLSLYRDPSPAPSKRQTHVEFAQISSGKMVWLAPFAREVTCQGRTGFPTHGAISRLKEGFAEQRDTFQREGWFPLFGGPF